MRTTLICGCTVRPHQRCETAEFLWRRWRDLANGDHPDFPVDMMYRFDAPQEQHILAALYAIDYYKHRGKLEDPELLECQYAELKKLHYPVPDTPTPVGAYPDEVRAGVQCEVLHRLLQGYSFRAATKGLRADRRTIYEWIQKYPEFARAVELARKKGRGGT